MTPTRQGSFRLFKIAGIDVYLHWSWFLVAVFEISRRSNSYTNISWNIAEYLSLFVIVMMHEFGHALTCRQVGGTANLIVLWPFGGVAYVSPPPRPGATLWSIAAGPLVNVVLLPLLTVILLVSRSAGWENAMPNVYGLLFTVWVINLSLLIFNILPVYPLDGGQILRSLLWYALGRARSLMVASIIGFVGVAGLIGLALWLQSVWFGLISAFIGMNCWRGFQQAKALAVLDGLPRRSEFSCPSCKLAPPAGAFWLCGQCRKPFDTFATHATCPQCGAQFAVTRCLECGNLHPLSEWIIPPRFPDIVSH